MSSESGGIDATVQGVQDEQSHSHVERDYRHFVPGAGQVSQPIDVEAWASSLPIDVDAFESSLGQAPVNASGDNVDTSQAPIEEEQAGTQDPVLRKDGEGEDDKLFQCPICSDTYLRPVV
ncbi:hypothetical protein B0H11DRAFT_2259799 [Mycena galericulata]|nr:hypothetical protein B0H11DRAFT_2259799 [Mycena galericulata]